MKMGITGLEEFQSLLKQAGDQADEVMRHACYAGAQVIADAIHRAIDALPEQEGYTVPNTRGRRVVQDCEKQALIEHLGVAVMTDNGGTMSTAVGFNGYTEYTTKQYPNGVPVPLLARSIESGSSVREKRPFVRPAVTAAKDQAVQAMASAATELLDKIVKP